MKLRARATGEARRHRPARRPRLREEDGDAHRDRRAHAARGRRTGDPLLPEHCPIVSTRPARSAIRRCGTVGRSAARSRTATRPRTCRPSMLALDAELVARGAGGRAGDPGDGVLHRCLRDGARAGRGARRDPRAEARLRHRLVVPQDEPPRPGLGDGRRRGARPPRRTERRRRLVALVEHGRDAAAGEGGRGCARGWRLGRTRRRSRPTGRSRRATTRRSSEFRRHLARVLTRRALATRPA